MYFAALLFKQSYYKVTSSLSANKKLMVVVRYALQLFCEEVVNYDYFLTKMKVLGLFYCENIGVSSNT
jgi:hypothetical protein